MQKSNLKLINPIFFCKPRAISNNWIINYLNNPIIVRSHKFKEILALTIEWSYEESHNNYA